MPRGPKIPGLIIKSKKPPLKPLCLDCAYYDAEATFQKYSCTKSGVSAKDKRFARNGLGTECWVPK